MSNMSLSEYYEKAWLEYIETTPSAAKISQLLEQNGEKVLNDHIALRTFNHPKCDVSILSQFFQDLGYIKKDNYQFPEKKLFAIHLEHGDNPELPKIFISQLLLEEFSEAFRQLIQDKVMNQIPEGWSPSDFYFEPMPWKVSFSDYQALAKESEYGAWIAAMGFRPNHFTISLNHCKKLNTVQKMNTWLKEQGFPLNSSGGEVKGSPAVFLEQSSIMADRQGWSFTDGMREIPTCYYEFALRYPLPDHKGLYQGFVATSADKIFESTDS